jgi:hypothetical protein
MVLGCEILKKKELGREKPLFLKRVLNFQKIFFRTDLNS